MTDNELWQEVRQYYYDKFGTAPELVDIAPVLDILRLCASGSSNKSIANFMVCTEQAISEIIDSHLEFTGFDIDMKFSPLKIYKGLDTKDLESFRNAIVTQYGYHYPWFLGKLHKICVIVDKLERLFDEKWI